MNLFLAPLVISQRMPLLWLESIGLAPSGPRESERMVTEKVDALHEGLLAAQHEMVMASLEIGTALWMGHSPVAAAIRGTKRAAHAAMEPSERRMRGNLKRLARRRLS